MSIIQIKNLSKVFRYPVKKGNWIKDLLRTEYRDVIAVNNINLTVEKGESIAFIGPNGAGKSTTIKMLTGILASSSGDIQVAGYRPGQRDEAFVKKIGIVFAQRSQLIFNLPLTDSFLLFGSMYGIPNAEVQKRLNNLIEVFSLQEFLNQPVRRLSLGQRMRAEIALSLLHEPEIVFLDEPTVGLDIVAKQKLREALRIMNEEKQITIFLTSHDVGDIEKVSKRTVIVNHGNIILDEETNKIRKLLTTKKIINVELDSNDKVDIDISGLELIEQRKNVYVFEVDTNLSSINVVLEKLISLYDIKDVNIDDPSLEDVISDIYQK